MPKQTPIINIFTYKLPQELAQQVYNEYQNRLREVNYSLENNKRYSPLKKEIQTVELLLALSIFYKRVIANLEGAVKFYGTVNRISDAEAIQMGSYYFTAEEKNHILALTIKYRKILEDFHIPENIFTYHETRDFLKNMVSLKSYSANE